MDSEMFCNILLQGEILDAYTRMELKQHDKVMQKI